MRKQSSLLLTIMLTILITTPLTNAFAFTNGQAASVVIGQPDFATVTSGSGNNKLNFPHSVTLDSAGNLFIVDSDNHRILKFNAPLTTGMTASVVIGQPDFATVTSGSGNNKLNFPSDVAFDFPAGNLFVLDGENNRVLRFNAPLTTGMTASVVIGQPDFATVTSGSGNNKLNLPDGFILDTAGNLFVSDTANNRVLRFNAPLTTGMTASVVIGQPDFATVTSGSGNNKLNHPHSVTSNSAGDLFVSDQFNNRVLHFIAPLTTGMTASVVIGQPDFATVTSGSGNNKLNHPTDITLDFAGSLLVSDGENDRVLQFNAPLTTGMTASVVIGQPDFATVTSGSGNNKLGGFSEGIVLDFAGSLLVTDERNNRILKFAQTTFVANQPFTGVQTFVDGSTFGAGTTFAANQPFTGIQTFGSGSTFGAGTTFVPNQPFTGVQTFGAGSTFGAGTTFVPNQPFTAVQTFSGTSTFGAGTTFAANQPFTGIQTFGPGSTFGAGATFVPNQLFTGVQTFSGVSTFGANTEFTGVTDFATGQAFPSGAIFPPLQTFPAGETYTFGPALIFDVGTSFGIARTFDQFTDFTGAQTFVGANTFGVGTEFGTGQIFPAALQTFGNFVQFGANTDFTALEQTFTPGMKFGPGTDFIIGQDLPANAVLGAGLLLAPQVCATAECTPPASDVLSPGELLLPGTDPAAIANAISASDESFAVEGLGVEMVFDTVTTAGTINVDLMDPALVLGATPLGDGQLSMSASGSTFTTTSSVMEIAVDTAAITGSITLTMPYDEANIPAAVSELELELLHLTGGVWVIESNCQPVDTVNNLITCTVTTLSPFATGAGPASGGGGGGSSAAPSFSSTSSSQQNPITINGELVTVEAGRTSAIIPTNIVKTQTPFNTQIPLYENDGYGNILHVSLYVIDPTQVDLKNAYLEIHWEKNKPLEIIDKNKIASDVKLISTPSDASTGTFDYTITFAKPIPKSDIVFYAWDTSRNAIKFTFEDAIQIVQDTAANQDDSASLTENGLTENTNSDADTDSSTAQSTQLVQTDITESIKKWGGYLPESISDSQMLHSIGIDADSAPSWVQKMTKFVVSGEITEQDFVNAVQYMYDKGIIK